MTWRPLLLSVALFLTACAARGPGASASAGWPAPPPLFLNVPFFSQQDNLCGPAALASVLHYWRDTTTVEEISRAIYLPQLKGTLGIDLAHFARDKKFNAAFYNGSLADVRRHLERGIPLVAFLNLGYRLFPAGHFVVLTGLDERKEEVIVHSGLEPNKPIAYKDFMAAWKKTEYWTLEVVPPGSG